jgi:hypothetical protein
MIFSYAQAAVPGGVCWKILRRPNGMLRKGRRKEQLCDE